MFGYPELALYVLHAAAIFFAKAPELRQQAYGIDPLWRHENGPMLVASIVMMGRRDSRSGGLHGSEPAAGHLAVLGLPGAILAELCLANFHKIPFTCSYLPGRSYAHMAFLSFVGVMVVVGKGAEVE